MEFNRFRNVGLWLAVLGLFIPELCQATGYVLPDNWQTIVNTGCDILVLAGIFNNPSLGGGYRDDGHLK